MEKRYIIVNKQDEVVKCKKSSEVEKDDIFRVSALWVTDKKSGDILLAQRAFSKNHGAGKWGPAAAGKVEKGENYKENIIREVAEEIGLRDLFLVRGKNLKGRGKHNFFCQWFFCEVDKKKINFVLEEREVEKVEWISRENLIKKIKKHPEEFIKHLVEHYIELLN